MALPIMVDRLTADELASLSAHELGKALNEVLESVAACGRLTHGARDRIMTAKINALRAIADNTDPLEAKCARIQAETELAHIRDNTSQLRLQSSILQSLLKAANIV